MNTFTLVAVTGLDTVATFAAYILVGAIGLLALGTASRQERRAKKERSDKLTPVYNQLRADYNSLGAVQQRRLPQTIHWLIILEGRHFTEGAIRSPDQDTADYFKALFKHTASMIEKAQQEPS